MNKIKICCEMAVSLLKYFFCDPMRRAMITLAVVIYVMVHFWAKALAH